MVLPDKTGKGFFVSHDQIFDALQSPSPPSPKNREPRPIPKPKLAPNAHVQGETFKPPPPSDPTPTRKVITVPIKKSAMPPSAMKEYKLKCYAERHTTQPLRRSARLAEKAANKL